MLVIEFLESIPKRKSADTKPQAHIYRTSKWEAKSEFYRTM